MPDMEVYMDTDRRITDRVAFDDCNPPERREWVTERIAAIDFDDRAVPPSSWGGGCSGIVSAVDCRRADLLRRMVEAQEEAERQGARARSMRKLLFILEELLEGGLDVDSEESMARLEAWLVAERTLVGPSPALELLLDDDAPEDEVHATD
jgi:hypothetical protein